MLMILLTWRLATWRLRVCLCLYIEGNPSNPSGACNLTQYTNNFRKIRLWRQRYSCNRHAFPSLCWARTRISSPSSRRNDTRKVIYKLVLKDVISITYFLNLKKIWLVEQSCGRIFFLLQIFWSLHQHNNANLLTFLFDVDFRCASIKVYDENRVYVMLTFRYA